MKTPWTLPSALAVLLAMATFPPVISPASAATPVAFPAAADAYVEKESPAANFGDSASLLVGRKPRNDTYLRFSVQGLTGPVERATLRLFATRGSSNGPKVSATGTGWSESGITWNTRPANLGGPLANVGTVPTGGWMEVDVTTAVPGNGDVAFHLETVGKDGEAFRSRQAAGDHPQLVVLQGETDTDPPDTFIDSGPSGTVATGSATFAFSSDEAGSTFECDLDGNGFVPCTSPTSYSNLSNGSHTFSVRATDGAGLADPSPASRTWTVDVTTGGGDPVLVGAGDIASCSNDNDEATAALLDDIDGTVFTTGDNVYTNGTDAEFAECYDPTWGRHKARTMPSVGNHEYGTAGAAGYFNYFGAAAGTPGEGWYSYDMGAWHVVVLNSSCSQVGGCGAGSPQEQWLRADLAASAARCTVAYWHHPRFSSASVHGSNSAYEPFWQALYDHGADLVLAGHDHVYERFAPQTPSGEADDEFGIRQITVGTGGRSHYAFDAAMPNSEVRNGSTYGVLRLTLHDGAYDWQFVPVAGATFTDSGSGACHDAPPSEPPPPPPPPPTPGTIGFVGAASDGSSTARSSISIGRPAGTQAGHVMVAAIVSNDDDPGFSAPAGWTLVRDEGIQNSVRQAVYVKVATASEPSAYTWTLSTSTSRRLAGGIISYAGVDTAQPVDAHAGATNAGGGTAVTAPSVTTTVENALLVHLAAVNAEGSLTPPTGMTERWEQTAWKADSPRDVTASTSDNTQAATGATGPRTATASNPGPNIGVLLALRPAEATSGATTVGVNSASRRTATPAVL